MAVMGIPRPIVWCLSGLHSLNQKWDAAKTAVGHRLDVVRAKIAPIQNKIGQGAAYCWSQLTPSAQRHIQLVWTRDAGEFIGARYEKNVLEEVGDWILYPSVDLPKKLLNYRDSPIARGLASIGAVFLLLNFVFHPITTSIGVVRKISSLPGPLRFLAKTSILGLFCRSVGRWTNTELMTRFNHPVRQVVRAEAPFTHV